MSHKRLRSKLDILLGSVSYWLDRLLQDDRVAGTIWTYGMYVGMGLILAALIVTSL